MLVAAVDIGTNSARMLLAKVAGGTVGELDRHVTITGLGRGVDGTGRLSEESMAATVDVLAGYSALARGAGVTRLGAVATSATRDAGNREAFLERATAALGVRPRVIDGAEEARFSFVGVLSALDPATPVAVIDPGGGSTEFVIGEDEPAWLASVDMGSVRLTERALPDRPAVAGQVAEARRLTAELFTAMAPPMVPASAVGVGGTYTALAAVHLELERYQRSEVHGTKMGASDFTALVERLGTMSVAETAAIPGLDSARAPVILAGAVVAEQALNAVGLRGITVSESDILDGLALQLALPG